MSDISSELAQTAPKGGFTGADYNAVATAAELEAINLLSSKFSIDPVCLFYETKWKLSFGRKVLSCNYSKDGNNVAAIFRYYVTGRYGRKRALHCEADYGVFYRTHNGATEEAAVGFCRNVGTFAAYPYFRALFAQLAAEAGLQMPPLPSIASTAHIPPKKSKKAKEK